MLERILGESYASPTDMGVNMVGFAITDDEAAIEASKQEIIRRYYQTVLDFKAEKSRRNCVKKIELLMNDLISHLQTVRLLSQHVKRRKKLVAPPSP